MLCSCIFSKMPNQPSVYNTNKTDVIIASLAFATNNTLLAMQSHGHSN